MFKRFFSLMLAAALMLAVFLPAAAEEAGGEPTFYIYTDNTGLPLNVHAEPYGETIGKLEQGAKVDVVSFISADWVLIRYDGAETGTAYVSRRHVIDMDPAEIARLAEEEQAAFTHDPLTDITAEIESAVSVTPYRITVRPARVTSAVELHWVPSMVGPFMGRYKAGEQLTVLKEMDHYLQVQDTDTGDVGYIHRMFAAKIY